MVTAENIGSAVIVTAADEFYKFIDGWKCTLVGFESGYAVIEKPSPEFSETICTFLVPPDQLQLERQA